jgi:hypothetical protein
MSDSMWTTASTSLSAEEAQALGVEAYVYFYPLVVMDLTRRQMTNLPAGEKPGFGPANAFAHVRTFPPADFRTVVRPNFDTLYSSAWLDLTSEPMIVSVPDTGGRYYLLPVLDMWTDVFAAPGHRTSGTGAADYAIVPPGWHGALPAEIIESPTPAAWIIARTQTNGPGDYNAVHAIQDSFAITPLSRWGEEPAARRFAPDPSIDMTTPTLLQINAMAAADYFERAADLLRIHPPHATDWSTLARLRRIGIVEGEPFAFHQLPDAVREGLEAAPGEALALMRAKLPTLARVVNGWQMNTDTMGVYGNAYLKRAIVAMVGLGANQPDDAIYPLANTDADGRPLDGSSDYVIHFDADELPPADAFWSITMYDDDGFQVTNAIDRFAIGDRDPLIYDADGSVDVYVQHDSPGPEREANWLPAPRGPLGVTMRLYAPRPEALDGRWSPPGMRRV